MRLDSDAPASLGLDLEVRVHHFDGAAIAEGGGAVLEEPVAVLLLLVEPVDRFFEGIFNLFGRGGVGARREEGDQDQDEQ